MTQDELLQFSLSHTLEMIVIFDSEGKVTYANESAREQLEYGDRIYGCRISDIFPGSFSREDGALALKCGIGMEEQEMMAYRSNHTCFPARARVLACGDEPEKYLCAWYDASERNLLEKKLAQAGQETEAALKVKSEFTANVTHELRTPVNGILGNAKELMGIETDEEKLKLLRLVERGCRDMNAIINNILDFSKLEAGKFTLEPRQFEFRSMIDYVKSNHINKITEKGLELFVTVSPEVPKDIIGDELRIVQILNNLMSNACKFTSVGKIGVEVVKTAQIDNRIELFFMVIDSGIGISKADQDKLFQSFSQVDASISRKYGGTGLGLNICKQLVELMDGSIRVESEPGKGTMFSFHIWVEIPQDEVKESAANADEQDVLSKIHQRMNEMNDTQKILNYGEPENLEEIRRKMSKLILSVEMDNWAKAEMFVDTLKQLTDEAPREVKSAMLRLKMAVQKADYDKTTAAFEKLKNVIWEDEGE